MGPGARACPLDLTITIVAVPVGAALAGWIPAGRTPSAVARQALD